MRRLSVLKIASGQGSALLEIGERMKRAVQQHTNPIHPETPAIQKVSILESAEPVKAGFSTKIAANTVSGVITGKTRCCWIASFKQVMLDATDPFTRVRNRRCMADGSSSATRPRLIVVSVGRGDCGLRLMLISPVRFS